MKHLFLLIGLTSLLSAPIWAQSIKGTVKYDDGSPAVSGTITLLHAADSSSAKFSATDEEGLYEIVDITPGAYILKIEDFGYDTYYSDVVQVQDQEVLLPEVQLTVLSRELEAYEVVYRRPIVELKPDMTVFNIDSTINAVGQNGLDLMRKSPGVLVDKDENITISGKNGVRVYIDGRPSPLTGSELSEFLKSLQSNSIDAIEIISSPSAKYDAQGNAGIINIRLKKNQNLGTNGSVNLGYAIGVYSKYNGGLSLNHRNGKFNVYGSYNVHTGNHWNEMNFERKLVDTLFNQKSGSRSENLSQNYKAGVDYNLSDKSVIGVMVTGNARNGDNYSNNVMDIVNRTSGELDRQLVSNNVMGSNRNNVNGNVNYSYNDKNTGKSFVADVDYGRYNIHTDQLQPNEYYNREGGFMYGNAYNIIAPTSIDILTAKADWEQNIWKGKLGVGAKASFINTQNDFTFKNKVGSTFIEDSLRSNAFNYDEKIQALYATYSRQFEAGYSVQAGLRLENTITEGRSTGLQATGAGYEEYDTTFSRNYFDFFPSLGVTFNKNPMSQYTLAYSKRIDRPNYQDLNPFEFKMDDYTYRKGNINLQPQITHSVSFSHNYKYMLNTRLEYSHVSNVFAELMDTSGFRMFQTKENLATQDMVSLNVSFPFMYKKWSSFVNLNTYYALFKADYGGGRTINLDIFSFNTYGQISYKVNDWLSAEVSGWYSAPGVWQGTFRSIGMGGVDLGAQARVLKGKGTFRASVGDVFRSMKWGGSSTFVGQEVFASGRWESTQLRLNFTYSFGDNKIKSRNRASGAEDEQSRTSESGGMGGGNN